MIGDLRVADVDEQRPPATATGDPKAKPSGLGRWAAGAAAFLLYFAFSLFAWWHVWSTHPSATLTCPCGDPSLFTWFVEWPAHALSHGQHPIYSTAMGTPHGVNLIFGFFPGLVLSPITWIFGPVLTLNLELLLSGPLSAIAMFWLLRRWVRFTPAAFVGGFFYGFSPFVITSLTVAHVNLGLVPIPPLLIGLLDELFFRQRRKPVVVGLLLGLLVAVQFLVGTEVLAMVAIEAVLALVAIVAYGFVRHPAEARRRAPYAIRGLATGAIAAGALLAYPVAFAVAGPAHMGGNVWHGLFDPGQGGAAYKWFVTPEPVQTVTASSGISAFSVPWYDGGYQGPLLSAQYFGAGAIAVLVIGVVLWYRDLRLLFFGALTALSVVLSHQAGTLLAGLPAVNNIVSARFALLAFLGASVMLGLIVDHTHRALRPRAEREPPGAPGAAPGAATATGVRAWWGVVVAALVSAVTIAPPLAYLSQNLPIAAQAVVLPTWFRVVPPHLSQKDVLLTFPPPFSAKQSAMVWQASAGMTYSMAGAGGTAANPVTAGSAGGGQWVLSRVTYNYGVPVPISSTDIVAVRVALAAWGVTTVVIPNEPDLPAYDQIASTTQAAGLITAATGEAPVLEDGAWTWQHVHLAGAPSTSGAELAACLAGLPTHGTAAVAQATSCVHARTVAGS
jgi:hypothetical protein